MFIKNSILTLLVISLSACSINQVKNIDNQSESLSFKTKAVISQNPDGYNEEAYLLAFPNILSGTSYQTGYQQYLSLSTTARQQKLSTSEYVTAKQAVTDGFNQDAYILAFPDIKNAVQSGSLPSGYYHYNTTGRYEGRILRTEYITAKKNVILYNEEAYLLAFNDIKIALTNYSWLNAYGHYLSSGKSEGRLAQPAYAQALQSINEGFNENAYIYAYPDLYIAVKNGNLSSGYSHYNPQGRNENRLNNPAYIKAKKDIENGFDEKTYLLAFEDVRHKVVLGEIVNAYWHYANRATVERKSLNSERYQLAKEGFSEEAYLLTFPDIVSGINSGYIPSAYWHYKTYSRYYEARTADTSYKRIRQAVVEGFNEKAYIMAFSDIQPAITNGYIPDAITHFLNTGINEGRLNQNVYKNAYRTVINKDLSGFVGED